MRQILAKMDTLVKGSFPVGLLERRFPLLRPLKPGLCNLFGGVLFAVFLTHSAVHASEQRLWRAYQKRDYFSLQRDLPAPSGAESAGRMFLRAATAAAFGQYDESSRMLRSLLQDRPLDSSIDRSARERLMLNERAMFRYRAALAAIAPLLPSKDASLNNRAALLAKLQDVPPETFRAPDRRVVLRLGRFDAVAASVNGAGLRLGIDTGANLSTLSRSAARAAGLRIRPADYRIRLAGRKTILAGLAIGGLELNHEIRLSNVVFLVVPDSALRAGSVDGLIGLPELSHMGPMRFPRDGMVAIGGPVRLMSSEPTALIEGDPVVRAAAEGRQVFCRIDSGSNRTVFYGWSRRQEPAAIAVAGHRIRVPHAIYQSRGAANQPYIGCNLGRDALDRLAPYTLDLHRMRIGLD